MPSWSSVITVVSIPSTIAVYGNGKAIGFETITANNETKRYGGTITSNNAVGFNANSYNQELSKNSYNGDSMSQSRRVGITAENDKSGIIAKSNSITKTSKSFKFCIKY